MLATKNVYLDTQTFVQNNYFQGGVLKELFDFTLQGNIKVLTSAITLNEIKSNFREDLKSASTEIDKFNKAIKGKGKVVKNLDDAMHYLRVPSLDVDAAVLELESKLDTLISDLTIEIIPIDGIDVNSVMTKYFNGEKPFGPGKKKDEFPDAMVMATLEKWCSEHGEKIYFISGDKDFGGGFSENIIFLNSLPEVLDKVNEQVNNDRYKKVSAYLSRNIESISASIKTAFIHKIEDEIAFFITIESVTIKNFEVTDHNIDYLDAEIATIQVDFDIDYDVEVTYEDHSLAYYDREDDKYFGTQMSTDTLEMEGRYSAEIEIEGDLDSLEENNQFSITCTSVKTPDEGDITINLDGFIVK